MMNLQEQLLYGLPCSRPVKASHTEAAAAHCGSCLANCPSGHAAVQCTLRKQREGNWLTNTECYQIHPCLIHLWFDFEQGLGLQGMQTVMSAHGHGQIPSCSLASGRDIALLYLCPTEGSAKVAKQSHDGTRCGKILYAHRFSTHAQHLHIGFAARHNIVSPTKDAVNFIEEITAEAVIPT